MDKATSEKMELRPCPFCGGDADLHQVEYDDPEEGRILTDDYCVGCANCCCCIIPSSKDGSIKSWNTRTTQPPPVKESLTTDQSLNKAAIDYVAASRALPGSCFKIDDETITLETAHDAAWTNLCMAVDNTQVTTDNVEGKYPEIIYLDKLTRRWFKSGEEDEYGVIDNRYQAYKIHGTRDNEPQDKTSDKFRVRRFESNRILVKIWSAGEFVFTDEEAKEIAQKLLRVASDRTMLDTDNGEKA